MKDKAQKVWALFRLDWTRIFANKLTLLLVIALMIIPSLYAWFNIAALWDPYAKTGDLPIAIYSEDETVTIMDKEINIGEKLITNLHDNKSLAWKFVKSKKQLENGVQSGKYFAGICIPKSFSKDLTSFVNGEINRPKIEYSVNQKINAIAPKVTDKGAGSIKDTITEEFIKMVSKTLLEEFNELGYNLEEHLPSIRKLASRILYVDANMEKIDSYTKKVVNLQKKMPQYKEKLAKANEFIAYLPEVDKIATKIIEVNKMMPEIKESGKLILVIQKKIPEIEQAGKQLAEVDKDMDRVMKILDEAIVEGKKGLGIIKDTQKVLPDVKKLFETTNEVVPEFKKTINSIEKSLPNITKGLGTALHTAALVARESSEVAGKLAKYLDEHELTPEDKAKIKQITKELSAGLAAQSKLLESEIKALQSLREITGSNELDQIISKLQSVKQSVDRLKVDVDLVTNNVERWSTDQIKSKLRKIESEAHSIAVRLEEIDVDQLQSKAQKMLKHVQDLLGAVGNVSNKVVDKKLIDRLDQLMTNVSATLSDAISFLEKYQKKMPAIRKEVHTANELLAKNMDKIIHAINKAAEIYQNDLPNLEKHLNKASHFAKEQWPGLKKDLVSTMDTINEKFPKVEQALDMSVHFIQDDWPQLKQGLQKAAKFIRKGDKENLGEIIKLLKSDVREESNFLANPIELEHIDYYPIPNYGSASSPFYTALCLWVGAVLLSSVANTKIHLSEENKLLFSKRQRFVARMGTFFVIAICQALIASVGNLVLLGAYAKSPLLYILFSIIVALVFMSMVYVLVALLRNLGKGAAIIILVLSISGGGGNFPVQMSGKFFQFINPFLPFTYAVNLLRESVGGIYWWHAIGDLIVLFSIAAIFIIVGYVLYPNVDRYLKKMNESLTRGHFFH